MDGVSHGIPMTRRIAAEMEARISDGTLPAGSRLPSVRDLAGQYEISTAVCLSAYRALEKKGLVERRAGSGTFVCGTAASEDPKNYFYNWDCVLPSMETMEMAATIEKETGVESRATVLGHVQRGGSPTVRDRVLASEMGHYAVKLLMQDIGNRVVAYKKDTIVDYDIYEALNMKKTFDMDLYKLAHEISI